MSFLYDSYISYVIVLSIIVVLFSFFNSRRVHKIYSIVGLKQKKSKKSFFSAILWFIVFIFFLLCLLRPYLNEQKVEVEHLGHDILFLLDLSKSMNVKDVQNLTRLEYSKWWIKKFVQKHLNDRVGLLSFAGGFFREVPLGFNHNVLVEKLEHLETDLMVKGGTNLENALKESIESLKVLNTSSHNIIVLTDGEEVAGDFKKVLPELKENKIKLFVVGVGNPHKKGVVRDETGEAIAGEKGLVYSQANQDKLREFASTVNGAYIPMNEIFSIKSFVKIDQLLIKSGDGEVKEFYKREELFFFFAPFCIFFFFFYMVFLRWRI